MIFDHITNCNSYSGLGPLFDRAFRFLMETDLETLALGRHAIEGDHLFAIIMDGPTKEAPAGWESHERYVDLQYVIRGEERMGFAQRASLVASVPYNPDKDIAWHEGEGDFLTARPGDFVIFFPQDAHMPSMASGKSAMVKKAVLKIEHS